MGTSDYLAPETIADPDRILPVSDIYALGCTLYYAVTAKVPFPAGKMADKMRRHLQSAPLNPLHFNPDLPAGFCEVIAQMMEKDCETRIPTEARVAELLAARCPDDLPHRLAGVATRAAESPRREPTGTSSDSPALSDRAAFDVGDLEPSFANELDSASQISQPTEPFHTAEDDTESQFDRPPHRESATSRSICPTARRWIYAALGLGIVGTIVWIISRW